MGFRGYMAPHGDIFIHICIYTCAYVIRIGTKVIQGYVGKMHILQGVGLWGYAISRQELAVLKRLKREWGSEYGKVIRAYMGNIWGLYRDC